MRTRTSVVIFRKTSSEEVATESKANVDEIITTSLASPGTNYSLCGNHDSRFRVNENC